MLLLQKWGEMKINELPWRMGADIARLPFMGKHSGGARIMAPPNESKGAKIMAPPTEIEGRIPLKC